MNIQVSDTAAQWYIKEMDLSKGDYVRFFARYGGCSTVQQGFSLGISNEEPYNTGASIEKDGITYFIEEKDLWYFDQHDLKVDYDEGADEPIYQYSA
ncbi:HesB/YadR/YfhF family protein [Cytobacillus gottheilii]|uniref:HesB/YadR/YfhF family protein n=1 Tax=Cytobacillus gottheilii TaxID=859144 RepID=A0ABX8F872_9BACI|nr:HesB/YadR/YfhF family protein [Cytobacillus gottheilii]QVY59707.1 HesB/YadR/YfhF family protein [Cytobacillus gottheilii]